MSITYEAVLPLQEDTAVFLTGLLDQERVLRGTRTGTRVLTTRAQAILVLRWFLDDTRMSQPARDNAISPSTAYEYRDEAITVLAARRPGLHGALLAAKVAGHTHVILDGTLIPTDRSCRPGPTPGVDLWWSGKHIAPRGALSYPRLSREEMEVMFLGPMPYLAPKGQGDKSMVGNQWSCPGVRNDALGDPHDMVNGWIA